MKTILSFIDWYLPGYRAGGVLKAFSNQIAHLEGKYEFKVITRDTDYCETVPYEQIKSNQWNRIAPNAEAYYISADQLKIQTLNKLVAETSFDLAYVHGVYSFYFSVLPVILAKVKKVPVVIGSHGMLGKHSLAVKAKKKAIGIKLARFGGFYKNVVFHAANASEAVDIRLTIGKKARILIAEELPMKIELAPWASRIKLKGLLNLCSVARISPEKNTLYAIEVLKTCTKGEIVFDIYGPVYNEEYWNQCKNVIAELPGNVKVNYKGSIPGDKVLSMLSTYHAMFMPTNGENFGHTILESFMASTPVIISRNTPWRNLEKSKSGWDLPLEDDSTFVAAINQLIEMDQSTYEMFSKASLQYAHEFMQNNSILEQNIKLFADE
ncbi:MAG: glycosyl transferase family protein [Bacteroidetes bacterium]|nr:MAG: glycosyl transferase family protein [Bacteroidota bacterium]